MGDTVRLAFAERYERDLVPELFRPWVDSLLQAAGVSSADRLLDVATGTGIVARVARNRPDPPAAVVGVDPNADMLAEARRLAPAIDWRQGSAERLPLRDGERFDVITCQQGLQFVPDRPRAVGELHRALLPGGRIALAVWRPVRELALFADLQAVAERRLGPIRDARYGFGESEPIRELLVAGGFEDVRVTTLERTITFADPRSLVWMNAVALVGMSAPGSAMDEDERARAVAVIADESAAVLRRYASGAGIAFRLATNIATARVGAT